MHPRTDPDHSRSQQQQAMHFFFLKPEFKGPDNGAHYAGGQHGYACAAQSLAAAGHNVHLLYTATKMELMFTLMKQGCMGSFSYSTSVEGVTVWSHQGITHHVSLSDAEVSRAPHYSGQVQKSKPPSILLLTARQMAKFDHVLPQDHLSPRNPATQLTMAFSLSSIPAGQHGTAAVHSHGRPLRQQPGPHPQHIPPASP
jgi:hypothetical protein